MTQGGRGRQISVGLKPAWSAQQVPEEPALPYETLSQKKTDQSSTQDAMSSLAILKPPAALGMDLRKACQCMTLSQWFSAFLMLRPWNTVPRVLMWGPRAGEECGGGGRRNGMRNCQRADQEGDNDWTAKEIKDKYV